MNLFTINNRKTTKMNTSIFSLLMVAILVFAGCSKDEQSKEIVKMDPISVGVVDLINSKQSNTFSVSGNIQPEKEVKISTRMMGFISGLYGEVGDYVKKGKVLVNINNADLQAKLAQVKANVSKAEIALQNTKKDFDRITKLYEQSSVTQKELDDISAHYNMVKSSLEAAKQMEKEVSSQFEYTRITAPFSGVISSKFVQTGELANPGMPLLTLAKTGNYEAVAMVPENQIAQLKTGQKAEVYIKSTNAKMTGIIDEIGVSSNNTGGQFIVKIKLDKHDQQLYAGMFSTITFQSIKQVEQNTLLIPENGIIEKGGLKGVYTVSSDNNAILRWLRLGRKVGDQYEVLSGLDSGDRLIVSSSSRLYNGAPLTIQ